MSDRSNGGNTVDSKVVELRFDNGQYEKGMAQSLETTNKFNKNLEVSGKEGAKSLAAIGAAVKKTKSSFTPLASGIDTVRVKFSAMQIAGITSLTRITNAAINTGKSVAKALTIEPITTGLQEYETQINAVQTILANTQKEHTNVKQVNKSLDELNLYADKTIYNFTEMTRNIGTFTAAGVKLKTSVNAIQGIANLAAVSGSTSQQASTAMYQLSQALATGTVKLMDWNSVVNAGMGGKVFQDALIQTSRELKTGADKYIKAEGSFRDSLSKGWLTSKVLTTTLKKFTMKGAMKQVASYTGLTYKSVKAAYAHAEAKHGEAKAVQYASKALAKKSGKNAKEIAQTLKFAKTAEDAATKVKTFSQMWDVLKEAAQSGWGQTWRIIIGDFKKAQNLITPLAESLQGIIDAQSNARNKILKNAFSTHLKKLEDQTLSLANKGPKNIQKYGIKSYEYFNQTTKKMSKKMPKLALGKQGKNFKKLKDTDDITKSYAKRLKALTKLSDAELKSWGYSKKQIQTIRDLQAQAEQLDVPFTKLVRNMDKFNGRALLIRSVKKTFKEFAKATHAVGDAWNKIIHGTTNQNKILKKQGDGIYGLIVSFNKWSRSLDVNKETISKLSRTFQGLFSIIKIVGNIVGGPLKIAFNLFKAILEAFDIDFLEFTATIGDGLVALSDFLDSSNWFVSVIEMIASAFPNAVKGLADFVSGLKDAKDIPDYLASAFPNAARVISNFISGLKETDNIPEYLLTGLANGIKTGGPIIIGAIVDTAKAIIETFKSMLGIHSPSTVFQGFGVNIGEGLLNGLRYIFASVFEFIRASFGKIAELPSTVSWNQIFSVIMGVATFKAIRELSSLIGGLSDCVEKVMSIIGSFKKVLDASAKVLKGYAFKLRTDGIKNIAISIGIIAASVWVLAQVDTSKLWNAVGAIAAISAILIILSIAIDKLGQSSMSISRQGVKFDGFKQSLLSIGAAILLLAVVMKILGSMNSNQLEQGFTALCEVFVAILGFVAAIGIMSKYSTNLDKNIKNISNFMKSIATSLLLMAIVVKIAGGFSTEEMVKGGIFIAAFGVFVWALVKFLPNREKIVSVGSTLTAVSVAMILMAYAAKIIGGMKFTDFLQGMLGIGIFVGMIVVLTKILKYDRDVIKVGGTILGFSAALLLMAASIGILGIMPKKVFEQGLTAVVGFATIITILVMVMTKFQGDAPKVAATLIAFSVALGVMAGVSILLGFIDIPSLAKGVVAVSILGIILGLMVGLTHLATDCKSTIIAISIAIGVMAASVAALSFIDPGRLKIATESMVMLIATLGLLTAASGFAKGAHTTVLSLVVVIVALTGCLYLLSTIPVENANSSITALSALLITMAGVLALFQIIKPNIANALTGAIALTAMAVPLLAFIGVLAVASGIQNGITNAKALTMLATVLTVLLVPLTVIGTVAAAGAAIGILALTAMAVPLLAFVGILALVNGIENATENAKLLTSLMTTMTICLVSVSKVAPLAAIAVASIMALTGVMVVIGVLAVGIGALMTQFPAIEEFLDKGIPILEKLGYAVGSVIGNIVAGFSNAVANSLPKLGTALSEFAKKIDKFVSLMNDVTPGTLTGVKTISQAILLLAVSNFISAIMAIKGSSISDLGTELSKFAINLSPFILAMAIISPNTVKSAKSLAEMIFILTASEVMQSISRFLGGSSSIGDFGKQLVPFGDGLSKFALKVKDVDSKTVSSAASAGKMLAEMASNLPNHGGFVSWFTGDSNMKEFGDQLSSFGEAIVTFAGSIKGKINADAITAAASTGKMLAEMASSISNSGGVAAFFAGDNDLKDFSDDLKDFGDAIVNFSTSVSGINADAVTSAANAGKLLAEMAAAIPNSGGLVSWFTGDNDMKGFGKALETFGTALAKFSEALSGKVDPEAITAAAEAAKSLAEMCKTEAEFKIEGDTNTFKTKLIELGEALSAFIDNVKGIKDEDLKFASKVIDSAKKLSESLKNLKDIQDVPTDTFNTKIESFGTGIKSFVDKFSKVKSKSLKGILDVAETGKKLAEAISSLSGLDDIKITDLPGKLKDYGDGISLFIEKFKNNKKKTLKNAEQAAQSGSTIANSIKNMSEMEYNPNIKNALTGYADGIEYFFDIAKKFKEKNINRTVKAAETGAKVADAVKSIPDLDSVNSLNVKTVIVNLGDAVKSFSSKTKGVTYGKVKGAISALTKIINLGAKVNKSDLNSAGSALDSFVSKVESAITKISNMKANMKTAGKDLVQGLINGIKANKQAAYNEAVSLGKAAVAGEKKGQQSNSPSKATTKAGKWLGEGLIIGMHYMRRAVKHAGNKLGSTAASSVSDSTDMIGDNWNFDTSINPIITPVLDLSNIQDGAGAISGMFGANPYVTLMTRFGAIESSMKNQNGDDMSDLLHAVNGLRTDMNNVDRDIKINLNVEYTGTDDPDAFANDIAYSLRKAVRKGLK